MHPGDQGLIWALAPSVASYTMAVQLPQIEKFLNAVRGCRRHSSSRLYQEINCDVSGVFSNQSRWLPSKLPIGGIDLFTFCFCSETQKPELKKVNGPTWNLFILPAIHTKHFLSYFSRQKQNIGTIMRVPLPTFYR